MRIRPILYLSAILALSPATVSATLMEDLFNGDSLAIPGVVIDNWSLDADYSSVSIDYSLIDVTAGWLSWNLFGIWYDFDDQLVVDLRDDIDIEFSYAISSAHGIEDNLLELSDPEFGDPNGGFIQAYEDVFTSTGSLLASKYVEIDNLFGTNQPTDHAVFPPHYGIIVEKRIVLGSDGDLVRLGDLHQEFSVPEPETLALMALGLVGLAVRAVRGGGKQRI